MTRSAVESHRRYSYRPRRLVTGRASTRLLLILAGMTASLAAAPAIVQAQPRIEIYQCRNGSSAEYDCTAGGLPGSPNPHGWATGAANPSNSLYREGDFVPFRVVIRYGLNAGDSYTLRIGYDAVETGLHAYDYLGSYDASRRPGQDIVPCSGTAETSGPHACGDSPSRLDVPTDTATTFASGSQLPGVFSAWGVRLTDASYVPPQSPIDASTGGTVERFIDLTFTAQGPAAVIAWGGHIASILNWGPGRTFAGTGQGAPFHMRLNATETLNTGQQDLALQAAAIGPRPNPFSTQVTPASVEVGDTVTDTAQLGGVPTPDGTVRFFVCGPAPQRPACTSGGTRVGHDEIVTTSGTAAIQFTPDDEGFYCFRAEFRPSSTAPFSPATHTNLTTECFQAVSPTPPPPPDPSTLTIVKSCVPETDSGRFRVRITGEGRTIRRTLRCGSTRTIELPPGSYRVTERGARGTNLARYTREIGGDCDRNGRVQIDEGESATCTISNVRRPQRPRVARLTLLKVCVPSSDGGRFNLRINGVVTAPEQRCGGTVGPIALLPGTYRVSETAGADTDASAYTTVIGGACGADGSITLTARESATCTITNIRSGTPTAVLTVVKNCQPADDNGRFVLDIDEQEFPGMRCGQSTGPITVAAGDHLVGEVATSPAIVNNYDTEFGGDCAATGTITLAAGQQATCTVTNIRVDHPPARRPPDVCYTVRASPRALRVGRPEVVTARVAVRGNPVRHVLVRLSGAGISRSRRSRANGVARFRLLPRATGTVTVTTPRQFGCPAVRPSRIVVRSGRSPRVTG